MTETTNRDRLQTAGRIRNPALPGVGAPGFPDAEPHRVPFVDRPNPMEAMMGFGRGILLWLIGIPLPIIILLALFWR